MRGIRTRGTLSLSWGPSGGFYLHPHRICLGRVALTYLPDYEVDDLMEAHLDRNRMRDELETIKAYAESWRAPGPGPAGGRMGGGLVGDALDRIIEAADRGLEA